MNSRQNNIRVNIPIDLIPYAFEHKLIKELKVMIAAKLISPGRIGRKDKFFERLCQVINLKPRTVVKQLKKLTQLGWVGHDTLSDTYYFRSFAWFRKTGWISKRASVSATVLDLSNFQALLVAGMVTFRINSQKYVNNRILSRSEKLKLRAERKSKKSATIISDVASQDQSFPGKMISQGLPYYGLSNLAIGNLLFISQTRACELKNEAVACGYLKTFKRLKPIFECEEGTPNLREIYLKVNGDGKKNIRINRCTRKGKGYVQLLEQLHDEIKPLIKLKSINYLRLMKQKATRCNNSKKFSRCLVVNKCLNQEGES